MIMNSNELCDNDKTHRGSSGHLANIVDPCKIGHKCQKGGFSSQNWGLPTKTGACQNEWVVNRYMDRQEYVVVGGIP